MVLPQVRNWNPSKVNYIMDTLHKHLVYLRSNFNLEDSTTIIKKERSVGIIPNSGCRILREQLEEMVLSCSVKLNTILDSSQNFATQQKRFVKQMKLKFVHLMEVQMFG